MRKSYLLGGALLAAALFVTTSCKEVMGSLDNPVKPYIELEKTTATLEYGETTTIKPSSINDKNPIYTFESLNPEIATVDEATGEVTAVDYDGEATIIAKVAANEYYQKDQTEFKVIVNTPAEKTPLSFEAKEDCKITVKFLGNPALEKPIVAVTNGVKQEITETTEIEVVEGQKVRFFSENAATAKNYDNNLVTILANDKPCYIYGNVMSMVTPEGSEFKDNVTFTADYALAGLFYKPSGFSNKIISHPTKKLVLPATTLTKYCYNNMFNGSKLDVAPEILPAEELTQSCYYGMFKGCKELTKAPEISATTVGNQSCRQMFYQCEKLTTAPALNATTINSNCYQQMFYGCILLTKAPEKLPATALYNQCYASMFYGCTSLANVSADLLPAETLASNCYNMMFYGCVSLIKAPELPALTANVSSCYRQMFYNCSNLSYVKCLATKRNSSTADWLYGVAANGLFVKNSAMQTTDSDTNNKWQLNSSKGIPAGWTVEDAN